MAAEPHVRSVAGVVLHGVSDEESEAHHVAQLILKDIGNVPFHPVVPGLGHVCKRIWAVVVVAAGRSPRGVPGGCGLVESSGKGIHI